jgi:hypothetical protein
VKRVALNTDRELREGGERSPGDGEGEALEEEREALKSV